MAEDPRKNLASPPLLQVPVVDGLRESEARFRALAEHARDVILEITPEAQVGYASPSVREMFGYAPEELEGRNALEFVHPEDFAEVDAIRATVFGSHTSAMVLFRFRCADGGWVWVELSWRPYVKPNGEVRGVLVGRDVSDRVRSERLVRQQLRQEQRMAELARGFLNLSFENFPGAMVAGLRSASLVADADRAQLYLLNQGHVAGHYSWTAPEHQGVVPEASTQSVARFTWAAQQLLERGELHVPSLASLPPEAEAEREGLGRTETGSYLAFRLGEGSGLLGFVDFYRFHEERPWSDGEIERMRLVAEVLAGALRRLDAENERGDAEERLHTIATQAQDTICEVTLDGRILYLSDNVEQLVGYPMGALQSVGVASLVHPEDLEMLTRGMRDAVSSSEGRHLTFRVRHNDGAFRWVEARVNSFFARSGESRLAMVLCDVTDRHTRRLELEDELALEKRVGDVSRELLEITGDGVNAGIERGLAVAAQLAGADRAFLRSGPAEGDSMPELHSWRGPEIEQHPHDWDRERASHRWVREQLLAGEVLRLSDPGAIRDPDVREDFEAEPVKSYLWIPIFVGAQMLGVLGFHCLAQRQDWSDRDVATLRLLADLFASALRQKQAEVGLAESQRRLLQAQKMEAVGTLAGGIAHDFNNQLTVMLSNARYALREAEPDSEVQQALGDLTRAAEHCAQLTRSLLAFSRRTPVAEASLAIGAVLNEAEELLRPLIPSSIRLEVHVSDAALRISADPTQLQQVLVNLVVNARDAMARDGGRLDVTARAIFLSRADAARLGLPKAGHYAEFAVSDTGDGMDEAVQARVFEPFYTTKPVGEGTGLGLATAYGIIEQCGGVIVVESVPGRGSTFRVMLPRCVDAGDEIVPDALAPLLSGAGTVLLAEDEASVRRMLARTLRDAGYVVIEAQDGAEALRLGRQQLDGVDAVVTDVEMPHLSGIDLARRLARDRPDLPVLFISGSTPEELGIGDSDSPTGQLHFLAKPFSEQRLLERLQEVLQR